MRKQIFKENQATLLLKNHPWHINDHMGIVFFDKSLEIGEIWCVDKIN